MNTTSPNGDVILGMRARRRFSAEEKYKMVEESQQLGNSISITARKYGMHPSQLFAWRKHMKDGSLSAVDAEEQVVPVSEMKLLKQRIRELERVLGKKTMENEILKEAVKVGREKKLISREPLRGLDDFE